MLSFSALVEVLTPDKFYVVDGLRVVLEGAT